jgi:hypothetical protein
MNTSNFSKVLEAGFDQYMLPLGGKRVPTPYRRNEIGSYQKVGPEFQGKSSPETLTETTQKLASDEGFDLEKASIEEIRNFMKEKKLGIDCSGFAYRIINFLTTKVLHKPLTQLGFEHVGRTNIAKFTSDEYSIKIPNFESAQAGDILRINSDDDILHGVIFISVEPGRVVYAHSSGETDPSGVHKGEIINGVMPEELTRNFLYNEASGDGIYRLKILT